MGVFYEAIPKSLYDWILKQKVFWVATAPLSNNGREFLSGYAESRLPISSAVEPTIRPFFSVT